LGPCCLTFHRRETLPLLAVSSTYWKKIPFRSCPVSPNTLVDVLAAFEVKVKPFSTRRPVIVAGVSAYWPAKPFAASLTFDGAASRRRSRHVERTWPAPRDRPEAQLRRVK